MDRSSPHPAGETGTPIRKNYTDLMLALGLVELTDAERRLLADLAGSRSTTNAAVGLFAKVARAGVTR